MKYIRQIKSPNKKNTSSIPTRMNIILGTILVLFAMLVAQLAYLQITYGGRFEAEVQKSDQKIISTNVPRGIMYDSKGRVLVGNQPNNAITYTKGVSVSTTKIKEISDALSQYISLADEEPTDRELADYYLGDQKNLLQATEKVPRAKRYNSDGDARPNSEVYPHIVQVVEDANIHFTKRQKTAAIIFKKISGAYQLSTIYLKNKNLTDDELAKVGEHLDSLPGVGVGTDWSRSYPNGDSMRSIIGSVSSEKSGLPEDNLSYYLTQGYSRNDRVGTSYLEKEYESILKGSKTLSEVKVSSNNEVEDNKITYPGTKGNSLTLTIDSQYQKMAEETLSRVYKQAQSDGTTQYSDGAYAVAMNPNTGAILAISGVQHNPKTDKTVDDALGVINRSFVMGSVVKGATVAGGLMSNTITPSNTTLPDTPIYLPATPVKKSVYPVGTFGSLTAPSALEVSSNIYMMQLTLRWVKASYVPNKYISMPSTAFETLRKNFAQFGLGQKTGIDLPGEVAGITGRSFDANGNVLTGSVLDLSYGNYDAYTSIQLVQYVSTIANGGYKMKPYLVKTIGENSSDGDTNYVYAKTNPQPQSSIPWSKSQLNVIKQGFYNVVHGSNGWGTAHTLATIKPDVAGKTGTAQSFYYDPDNPGITNPPGTATLSFVGYAPANKPEIAIAVVFPNLESGATGHYNLSVAQEMFTNYFKLYK